MYRMDRVAWVAEMEELAPPGLAEEFDIGRIGLIIEGRQHIGTVCCALDATTAVVTGCGGKSGRYARRSPHTHLDPSYFTHRNHGRARTRDPLC